MLCLWRGAGGGRDACGGLSAAPVLPGGMAEEHGDPAPDVGFHAAFLERHHHDVV